ncbi:MAG TPA: response regulator transcription factor [Bacteroidales bacterium]|nr:response regulator transcription factor [Bacteroidales bacterium]
MKQSNKNINLVLVDDHILFRDGLKYVIEQNDQFKIVAEASNGKEFLQIIKDKKPDIVLMDIAMPVMNGIEATMKAVNMYPDIKIIALTMFDDEKYYYDILNAGAKGFLLKDSDSEDLLKAIESINNGESYFSNEVLVKVIRSYSTFSANNQMSKPEQNINLSFREQQVLNLICGGLTNKEIANELSLNQRTVEGIRYNLLSKTNSNNSLNLVLFAIENKLIDEINNIV